MPFLMSFGEANLASADEGTKIITSASDDFKLKSTIRHSKEKENHDPNNHNPAENLSTWSSFSSSSSSSSEVLDDGIFMNSSIPANETLLRQRERQAEAEQHHHNSKFMDPATYFSHLEEVHKEYVERQKEYMEKQKEYIEKLYHNTVDGPCQTVSICDPRLFDDQLDLFTNCQQPLSFFPFFHEGQQKVVHGGEVLPLPGAYAVPNFCEYCGAPSTALCKEGCDGCQRPRLYFQKKRPPFARKNPKRWDPKTEYAVEQPKQQPAPPQKEEDSTRTSWVSDLFGGTL